MLKRRFAGFFLRRSLPVLLSLMAAVSVLSIVPTAAAKPSTRPPASSRCPNIPASFDFAHASKDELHRYLLPARPPAADTQLTSDWQNAIEATIQGKGICVPDHQTTPDMNHGQPVIGMPALFDCINSAPPGTQCSNNWNGYLAGDGTQPGYNEVVGKWNVECVTLSQSPTDSAMSSWIGLGGNFPGDDLWQVGSGWDATHGYHLWYQAVGGPYGQQNEQIFHATTCGDHIYADIWFAPNNPTSNVAYYLTDNGTVYRGVAPLHFASGSLSAEWIDERPACGLDQHGNAKEWELADYNYSEWTHAYTDP